MYEQPALAKEKLQELINEYQKQIDEHKENNEWVLNRLQNASEYFAEYSSTLRDLEKKKFDAELALKRFNMETKHVSGD